MIVLPLKVLLGFEEGRRCYSYGQVKRQDPEWSPDDKIGEGHVATLRRVFVSSGRLEAFNRSRSSVDLVVLVTVKYCAT